MNTEEELPIKSRHGPGDTELDPLMTWESVVDRAISAAREEGSFDNLPDAGKPLDVQGNPFNPEWDSEFRTLTNAGMASPWIEADKNVRAVLAKLNAGREAIAALRHRQASSHPENWSPKKRRGWHRGRRGGAWLAPDHGQHASPEMNADGNRERARRQFLDLGERVDAQILTSNAMLPDGLRWRERRRFTQPMAAAEFDRLWPPSDQTTEAAVS